MTENDSRLNDEHTTGETTNDERDDAETEEDEPTPLVTVATRAEFGMTVSGKLPELLMSTLLSVLFSEMLVRPFLDQVAWAALVVTVALG